MFLSTLSYIIVQVQVQSSISTTNFQQSNLTPMAPISCEYSLSSDCELPGRPSPVFWNWSGQADTNTIFSTANAYIRILAHAIIVTYYNFKSCRVLAASSA
ncbi:hypothetical protein V1527DRAFT_472319 [Lipomyces starkeyi]